MPLVHLFLVTLSNGEERLGCNADHLPLHSCEVKSEWSYTSIYPAVIECTGPIVFEVHLKHDCAHYHLTLVYSKPLLL